MGIKLLIGGFGLLVLNLQLQAQPVITSPPANQPVVWGGDATFSVMATGVGPLSYQWQLNGTNLPNNIITTVAGGQLFDHQAATNTILNSASGVATDGAGNIFIADSGNNVIRKVGTNGLATVVAGNGIASFSGDGGLATNAGLYLYSPNAIVLDAAGDLFIADAGNNRIRKVDTNGFISTIAGSGLPYFNGVPFNVGDNGAATNAGIYNPASLCLDAAGNIFIADVGNNRIRKVATNGIITTFAGNGNAGYSGDNRSATSANLHNPTGVAMDVSNNLFIADSYNSCIRKVNSSGIISTVAGKNSPIGGYSGDGGAATSARMNNPVGIALDAGHNWFIVDSGNHCVRKVGTNNIITTVAGNGAEGYSGDGGAATNANLANPQNLAVDGVGNLIIADAGNNRIRQVGTNGVITTIAGRRLNDGDYATNATLNTVRGVAVDVIGNLYLGDARNHCLRKVDTNGIITTIAGNGFPGYSGDGAIAANATLNQPSGVAVDTQGNLYVADTGNYRIRKVDTNGYISTVAGVGVYGGGGNGGAATNAQISEAYGVAVDAAGNLFIADTVANACVRKVDTNGVITTVNTYLGANPFGVAVDSAGNLFAAYIYENVIRELSTNGASSTVAGYIFSNGSFSGDGGWATNASLNQPEGVAVDMKGNLFISDTSNYRIRKVNTNGIISTIAGNGIAGYSGDGGPANNASMHLPFGLAADAAGNVYFADQINNRVRKVAYVDYADQPSFTVTNVTPGSVSNRYTVVVTSASGSVTSSVVTVNLKLPPITPVFTAANNLCSFTWSAVSNVSYQLQYATNLVAAAWIDLGSPITASNNVLSATDDAGADGPRFYRVRLWP